VLLQAPAYKQGRLDVEYDSALVDHLDMLQTHNLKEHHMQRCCCLKKHCCISCCTLQMQKTRYNSYPTPQVAFHSTTQLLHTFNRPIRYICQTDCSKDRLFCETHRKRCRKILCTTLAIQHVLYPSYKGSSLLVELRNACQCSVPYLVLPLSCDLELQSLEKCSSGSQTAPWKL